MASSGSFSGSICSGHYILRVDWRQTQNVDYNTSTITADIYLVNDWRLAVSGHFGNSCSIDGDSQDFWSPAINGTGTYYMDTVTGTVTHNSDGSKTMTMNVVYAIGATISGTYYSSITASATITLDSIARASSVSSNSVDMGSTATIRITRASSSFTHTLQYSFGSASGTIVTKTSSTTVNWTPPESLASQIPNGTSAYCTITCHTYNGNTWIGAKSCSMILSVPSTMKPTITSLTAARVDETVPSSWGIYVQSKSKATLTINGASGIHGSTIQSYSIWGNGSNGTSSTLTTAVLKNSGNNTFYATVTDSRGRTSDPVSVTINVTAYSPPSFSSYLSQRCVDADHLADDGTNIRCVASYAYSSCGGNNSLTTAVYYKASSASTWTNANKTFTSGIAFVIGNNGISGESSYDVKYTLTDAFGTITVIDTVSTASVVMDFKQGGKGVAVGKVSETDNCFEVAENWDMKVYGMLLENYIQSKAGGDNTIPFCTCDTAANVTAKEASCPGFTLQKGTFVAVKFTNTNSESMVTLNINNTGAKYLVSYANYIPGNYFWKPGQTVILLFDGNYYVTLGLSSANTTYYGITKLSNSVNSTDGGLAATSYAVKLAYDRNSWDSISLTNALAISYGGTGATSAAGARSNLGISATQLYSGTFTTGSTYVAYGYKLYVIIGQPSSSASRTALVIPGIQLTTTATNYQFADESNYYSFALSYSGSNVTITYKGRSSSGQIIRVYGIN